MIVACPSCTTRYDIAAPRQGETVAVTCRVCAYHWKEVLSLPQIEHAPSRALSVIEHQPEPDIDYEGLVEAAKVQRLNFLAKRKSKVQRTVGWAGLGLVAILPFMFAAIFPNATVLAAPITAKAYQRIGWDVNVYGLDIRHVEQLHQDIGGQHVLQVKGIISNPTMDMRKIPALRFALLDDNGVELYTWTLDQTGKPLKAGDASSFSTKLAAPPELAKNLQIRFAHADEIGSNGT